MGYETRWMVETEMNSSGKSSSFYRQYAPVPTVAAFVLRKFNTIDDWRQKGGSERAWLRFGGPVQTDQATTWCKTASQPGYGRESASNIN